MIEWVASLILKVLLAICEHYSKLTVLTFWTVLICTFIQLSLVCRDGKLCFSSLRESSGKILYPLMDPAFQFLPWPGVCSLFCTGYIVHKESEENCCNLHDALIFTAAYDRWFELCPGAFECWPNRVILLWLALAELGLKYYRKRATDSCGPWCPCRCQNFQSLTYRLEPNQPCMSQW